jgi:hypothetical protein
MVIMMAADANKTIHHFQHMLRSGNAMVGAWSFLSRQLCWAWVVPSIRYVQVVTRGDVSSSLHYGTGCLAAERSTRYLASQVLLGGSSKELTLTDSCHSSIP